MNKCTQDVFGKINYDKIIYIDKTIISHFHDHRIQLCLLLLLLSSLLVTKKVEMGQKSFHLNIASKVSLYSMELNVELLLDK